MRKARNGIEVAAVNVASVANAQFTLLRRRYIGHAFLERRANGVRRLNTAFTLMHR